MALSFSFWYKISYESSGNLLTVKLRLNISMLFEGPAVEVIILSVNLFHRKM